MSTSTWEGPEPSAEETYPPALLKRLLKHMMAQFPVQGGCIALFDESFGQMRVELHLRIRNSSSGKPPARPHGRQGQLHEKVSFVPSHNNLGRMPYLTPAHSEKTANQEAEIEVEEVVDEPGQPFARGTLYPLGNGLIGHVWQMNNLYTISYNQYVQDFYADQPQLAFNDVKPTYFLAVPIREATLNDEVHGYKTGLRILGIVVLYQTTGINQGFSSYQRNAALPAAECIALYLQNEQLRRAQSRHSSYLQLLQKISIAFPTTVKVSDLVETVYQFTQNVVDISAMLFTIYDRDKNMLYDVFAVDEGMRVASLIENPRVTPKEERPTWWNVTQQMTQREHQTLLFSPKQDVQKRAEYQELLVGSWGDQRHAESFLFLPLRMFNRVIGSLSITSMQSEAYGPVEVQVLETMVQIVTVSIENANLYQRDREVLQRTREVLNETKYREEQLATMNSLLQTISSTLDLKELLTELVKSVALVVNAELSVFFQLSPSKDVLIAKALYGTPRSNVRHMKGMDSVSDIGDMDDMDGIYGEEEDDSSTSTSFEHEDKHDDLIEQLQLSFKGTFLQTLSKEGFFYLDHSQLEELMQNNAEVALIFLAETNVQQMLMIPVSYKHELLGMLGVQTPKEKRVFVPRVVGILLAISSQAANGIHTAQMFEQRALANAELERLNKLKDEFLVTASHELRTPLTAITGYTSQLKRQASRMNTQQITRTITRIAGAAQQLSDMLVNITDATRVGAVDEKIDMQMGPVQLFAAAEMANNLLSVNVEQHIIQEVPTDIWVYGDALRIRQVISNLLDNAAKYSPPEGQIRLSAQATTLQAVAELLPYHRIDPQLLFTHGNDPVVIVRVQDQGEGIQLEDQQRIFEKFVRATRSLTTPIRGSGLGLYICRRYIEVMNGWLWLEESISGKGSTFSFYLPMIETPHEVERQGEEA